jgi:hypothetical protein
MVGWSSEPVWTLWKREEITLPGNKPEPPSPSLYRLSEKVCSSATFFTSNSVRPNLESNPGGLGGKPATNRLNCGVVSRPRGATLNSAVFQFVTLCSSDRARRFGGTCRHHIQGGRINQEKKYCRSVGQAPLTCHLIILVSCLAFTTALKMTAICSSDLSPVFKLHCLKRRKSYSVHRYNHISSEVQTHDPSFRRCKKCTPKAAQSLWSATINLGVYKITFNSYSIDISYPLSTIVQFGCTHDHRFSNQQNIVNILWMFSYLQI